MPEGWRGERTGWPEDVETVTGLLNDKGKNSKYSLILEQLEEDVAALETDEGAPTRFWHNPYRLLQDVKVAGLPAKTFPVTEHQPLNFTRFITDDEVDNYLTRGGAYSQGKLRILSHFLHDHTQRAR